MQFIRATAGEGAHAVGGCIRDQLAAGKRVLWFYSGGSNIPLAVQIMKDLPSDLTNRLVIMPIDERYGPLGHEDSNGRQLLDAGFDAKQATLIPILDGSDETKTVQQFAHNLEMYLSQCDVSVAQLGMGSDGHVAGILPHSPAVSSQEPVIIYDGSDGRRRITPTFQILRQLSATYLLAFGDNKRPELEKLRDLNLPLAEQPAQILKELSNVYVYNDQIA